MSFSFAHSIHYIAIGVWMYVCVCIGFSICQIICHSPFCLFFGLYGISDKHVISRQCGRGFLWNIFTVFLSLCLTIDYCNLFHTVFFIALLPSSATPIGRKIFWQFHCWYLCMLPSAARYLIGVKLVRFSIR